METWKDIPDYEGIYQASNEGRIRTAEGKTTFSKRTGKRVWKQRVMRQKCCLSRKGRADYRVELWKDGVHKTWLVSRLIAMTWCDGYKEGMTVNHIDGNPLNNKADNLEWVSLTENIRHGFETGLYQTQKECILINESGEKKRYRSQSQASISIGRNEHYVTYCLSKGKQAVATDGSKYQIIRQSNGKRTAKAV